MVDLIGQPTPGRERTGEGFLRALRALNSRFSGLSRGSGGAAEATDAVPDTPCVDDSTGEILNPRQGHFRQGSLVVWRPRTSRNSCPADDRRWRRMHGSAAPDALQ
jgi:hypothetical protein